MRNHLVSHVLGLVGAVIGGVLGYYLVFWIRQSGFYGMMIPGAVLGWGSSLLARHRSVARGVVCTVAALGLGLFTEWNLFTKFKADGSFGYLVKHFYELEPVTLFMIAFGAFFAFWLGKDASPLFGRVAKPSPSTGPTSTLE
jgi:hypothetical protein